MSKAVKLAPIEICGRLQAWADAAEVTTPGAGRGALAVRKSDLLGRLIYGGEKAPSQTPCPVHKGKWSGCHWGWPGSDEVSPFLQEWWDAGCRCATHKGSSCTTGWNPDTTCGCSK